MDSYLLNEGCCVIRRVEKWVGWIPPINDRFKLNFDGSKVRNNSAIGWVIRDSNGILKNVTCKYIDNSSIIIIECMTLRDYILTVKNKSFLNLEVQGDSKIDIY